VHPEIVRVPISLLLAQFTTADFANVANVMELEL